MPASPTLSAISLDSANSNSSGGSTATASTRGSARYVPPNLRKTRNVTRFELDIARSNNELAAENAAAAKHMGPKLPVFNLPFCLSKDQLNFITSRFPRTTFRCTSDVMHDHPLAHTEMMIATTKAVRMIPANHKIIDLFGSPSKCEEFNRSQARSTQPKEMVAYVATMTEKDYVRALRWGPESDQQGNRRYVRSHTGDVIADVDPHRGGVDPCFGVTDTSRLTYFSRNTLYYMSDYQIASLLRPTGSRMIAIVHRHLGKQGNLFGGEITFGKVSETVEQVNALTGERYVHRDLSWLWDSKTKVVRTEAGAFVWTFHMVSPETWIIELTGCPAGLDERVVSRTNAVGLHAALNEDYAASMVPSRFPHPGLEQLPSASALMVGGIPVITFKNSVLPPVRLTCPELYEFLRLAQSGKPRDGERLLDLFSLARSHVANSSEFPGKRNFKVDASDLPGHVVMAFVSGLKVEVELMRSIEVFHLYVKEHSALLSGDAVRLANPVSETELAGKTALSVLSRANKIRTNSDWVSGALELFQ